MLYSVSLLLSRRTDSESLIARFNNFAGEVYKSICT
jgi:hypothetical protein